MVRGRLNVKYLNVRLGTNLTAEDTKTVDITQPSVKYVDASLGTNGISEDTKTVNITQPSVRQSVSIASP